MWWWSGVERRRSAGAKEGAVVWGRAVVCVAKSILRLGQGRGVAERQCLAQPSPALA